MANLNVNKVIYGGDVLIDLTGDSVSAGSEDMKPQSKEVTPSKEAQTIMPDEEYNCLSQVTVKAIPYVETDNSAGGKTVTIG